ncbi:MAG: penicillin-binding protein 1C, partial [Bauldia sp.]|nr:penicillin-binding protein 1C [Bauldia sp.]
RMVFPKGEVPGLAMGLGGVGVTLSDLTMLYAGLARQGMTVPLVERKALAALARPPRRLLDPVAAWYVGNVLLGTPPPSSAARNRIAFKTGTSYGYRDAWAVGFDGSHVVGVWLGRPDGTAVPGLSGIGNAAPLLFEAFTRIGPKRTPLKRPPGGALVATTAQLPAPLRRFRRPNEAIVARDTSPEIAFPRDGVEVDLGIKAGEPAPLVIKVRNGAPPFTFFANGVPIGRKPFDRAETWLPDGPGFVTLSVVDSSGRSDRVTVFVE